MNLYEGGSPCPLVIGRFPVWSTSKCEPTSHGQSASALRVLKLQPLPFSVVRDSSPISLMLCHNCTIATRLLSVYWVLHRIYLLRTRSVFICRAIWRSPCRSIFQLLLKVQRKRNFLVLFRKPLIKVEHHLDGQRHFQLAKYRGVSRRNPAGLLYTLKRVKSQTCLSNARSMGS